MSELLASIRADQRARWAAGERVLAEAYLDLYPVLVADDEQSLDLIYSEVLLREEFGEAVAADEYLRRFPRYAPQLARQFELHALVRGPALDDRGSRARGPQGFELVRELGRGTWGVVYEAVQVSIGRRVALKMRHPGGRPEQDALLRREAKLVARLDHPNIARLYHYDEYDGRGYVVMELVAGGTLASALAARGVFPDDDAAKLVERLARAVHVAHQAGVVHRDLKPANILLAPDGTPKVTDFGLALDTAGANSLGASGAVIGTLSYMAPEQAAGRARDVGPTADVYALGLILHELLTGTPPRVPGAAVGEPVSPEVPVPPWLESICRRCQARRPRDRYRTAEALADDLARWLRREMPRAASKWFGVARWVARRWAVALVVLAVSAGVGVTVYHQDPDREARYARAELDRGLPVTVIPASGAPLWFRVRSGDDSTRVSVTENGAFTVHSWDMCLVELVPDSRHDRYTFRAEVQHVNSDVPGQAGLYVADRTFPGYGRDNQLFVGMVLNDVHNDGTVLNLAPPNIRAQLPIPKNNLVRLGCGVAGERAPGVRWDAVPNGVSGAPFEPRGVVVRDDWRTLEIAVTPDEVSGARDGVFVGRVDRKLATRTFVDLRSAAIEKHPQAAALSAIDPAFAPRGGVGLVVFRGSASFRSAVVTPCATEP